MAQPAIGTPPGLPLVGRDAELAVLLDDLSATRAGTGGSTVLTGPAGIGKTRLLSEVQAHAAGLGVAVAAGQAIELDRMAPLATLINALRRACPEPIDVSGLRDRDGDRLWYIDRLGAVLERYCAKRPLLVIVDDAQWADEFSALALRVLIPQLSSSPLRWLLARRPVPRPSPVQETLDWLVGQGARQVRLHRLDEQAVTELCTNVLGAAVDATVLTLAARGRGNPFLLEQLLTALRTTGQIMISEGVASVVGHDLPSSFLSAVEQRLGGLSPTTISLLRAGSIFGRPFTVHAAARLAGMAAVELVPAAEEAVSAGLLRARDTHLNFAHDLLRQAVYHHISGPVRATLHREAAVVMGEEGASPVEIAQHLMLTGPSGDKAAVQVLRAAANEVAGKAPSTAADFMLRALGLLGQNDPERLRLTAEAVGLLSSAGRLIEASDLGEAALLGGLDSATEARLLLGLAESLKHAGQNRIAVEYARRALARPSVPAALQARLHAIEAHALLYIDDMPGAAIAGARAARLGEESGEHAAAAFGSAARSVVARADGRLFESVDFAQHGVAVADQAGGEARQRHPRIWLGAALAAVDRFTEAERAFTQGRQEAVRMGTAWSQPLWHFYMASLLTVQGRLDDAVAEAEAGMRIAEQLTAMQLCLPLSGLLARVSILRDQMSAAREHLRRMRGLLDGGVTAAPEDVTWPMGMFHHAEGNPLEAMRVLANVYGWPPGRQLLISTDAGAAAELVRIAMRAGEPDQAQLVVDSARDLAARNPGVSSLTGAAAHAEGLLNGDLELLRRAVGFFEDSPRPLARAAALEDTAAAERAAGHREEAARLLTRAIEESSGCGAARAVERLEAALVALGEDERPQARRQARVAPNRDRLTAMEENIARMVAAGMTNAAIADQLGRSPHTVDSHLRKVFAKLGVNSRNGVTRIILSDFPPDT